jgi:hypothetical protein
MTMVTAQLQAGVASADISPARACDLAGFLMRTNPSTGVHDPVYARALALDDGGRRALLIVCDLLGFEPAAVAELRQAIRRATGVPEECIMLACTHTHAAPASMALVHCGDVDPAWMAGLGQHLAALGSQALAGLAGARIASGSTAVPGVSANRRESGGAVDRDLDMVQISGARGSMAALTVFGCHPVAAGHENRTISSDYPGVLRRHVEAQIGGLALAATGACGDVNPATPGVAPAAVERGFALVESVALGLAQAAGRQWGSLVPLRNGRLGVAQQRVDLPFERLPERRDLAQYAARMRAGRVSDAEWRDREPRAMLAWAERIAAQLEAGQLQPGVAAELQAITIGDLAIVGVPGELFAAHGLEIKRRSPARHTVVLGYTNGNLGYFPTRAAYPAGGYEVESAYRFYGYPSAFAPEAGELICEAALATIDQALAMNASNL